jgi:hypothetical protein
MLGGWYSYTLGSLSLVPEVQYVYAKPDQLAGVPKFTSNLGAAVFADYSFGTSPYSIGAFVDYENSIGDYDWFVGPRSEAAGISVSPTWQYKYLFARADVGGLYLLKNKEFSTASYGDGTKKGVFMGTLEAGILF